ncbi:MAG TPA: glutamine--tRNA ligase/YqeY domain fusion protein [Gammaproteobacteria bacterium]|nr:glutamine--tRNA ligase/YqeY domain fusion protein [Gammaproteobacteria bacterium]
MSKPIDFIRQIITKDLADGKNNGKVVTRFPPEPNGYLHIGHAKSICLNFGIAREFSGQCNLRFDDTNPAREDEDFVRQIEADVKWLGFQWQGKSHHASDYFEQLYQFAEQLIERKVAYVCSLDAEQIRVLRGTLTEVGSDSPYRQRTTEENLDFFRRMRAGEFCDGEQVLRAKIDMASPNLNMRDPVLYRIRHLRHHLTGTQWCIYPTYDFTHCLSDAIEGVTHSLCTLEFEDHRPLYDWILQQVDVPCHPQQIEFSRLSLDYTLTSKRMLTRLVNEKVVSGWDDPRMPTLSGMRRRGVPAAAIRDFCNRIGVTRKDQQIESSLLDFCIRQQLDHDAPRAMAVLDPLKIIITNYPAGQSELLPAPNHPNRPELGHRQLLFSRELYIERSDFMENPPKKFFRLAPGREVRLRYAYLIRCEEVIRDTSSGEIIALRCHYDPLTRGGSAADGRKVKATLHWVSAAHAVTAQVRLYDRLFTAPTPDSDNFINELNTDSITVINNAQLEASLAQATDDCHYQFERLGYFYPDSNNQQKQQLAFNRTITLRDNRSKKSTYGKSNTGDSQ